jgi:small subunit ribosomal protein S5
MDLEFQPSSMEQTYDERVIEIARVAKVVKGGRRFQFRVTVVAGDNHGKVGLGVGKANAVPEAMRKASERAHKDMQTVVVTGTTVPHEVTGRQPVRALSPLAACAPCWKLRACVISSPSRWAAPMC